MEANVMNDGPDVKRCLLKPALTGSLASLLALLFIIVFYGVLVIWEPKRKYSIEGLLRWLM